MARRKRCLRAAYGEDVQYSISHPSSAVEYKHVWDKMQIPESISPARLRVQISVHTVSALSHCHATLFRPDPRTTCSSCRLRGKRGRLQYLERLAARGMRGPPASSQAPQAWSQAPQAWSQALPATASVMDCICCNAQGQLRWYSTLRFSVVSRYKETCRQSQVRSYNT